MSPAHLGRSLPQNRYCNAPCRGSHPGLLICSSVICVEYQFHPPLLAPALTLRSMVFPLCRLAGVVRGNSSALMVIRAVARPSHLLDRACVNSFPPWLSPERRGRVTEQISAISPKSPYPAKSPLSGEVDPTWVRTCRGGRFLAPLSGRRTHAAGPRKENCARTPTSRRRPPRGGGNPWASSRGRDRRLHR